MRHPLPFPARIVGLSLAALAASCATPVFNTAGFEGPQPFEVSSRPERYHDVEVVWGGKILDVRNGSDTTEIEVIAYPLDEAQRPQQGTPTIGRFLIVMPGYVERLDYPPARFLTLRGQTAGVRSGQVDEHEYVFPLVERATIHLWPVNFPYERARVSFGIGVGAGLH